MPRLLFFLASQSSSVDALTNNLSVFEIIEELRAKAFPVRMRRADFIALWQRQPGEENVLFEQQVRLVRPDGREIVVLPSKFKLEGERGRVINRLFDLPLEAPGFYRVELSLRPAESPDWGIPVRIMTIPVVHVQKPGEETGGLTRGGAN